MAPLTTGEAVGGREVWAVAELMDGKLRRVKL